MVKYNFNFTVRHLFNIDKTFFDYRIKQVVLKKIAEVVAFSIEPKKSLMIRAIRRIKEVEQGTFLADKKTLNKLQGLFQSNITHNK